MTVLVQGQQQDLKHSQSLEEMSQVAAVAQSCLRMQHPRTASGAKTMTPMDKDLTITFEFMDSNV